MLISEIDYSGLPPHCQEGLRAYIEQRRQTGGFLYAVLSNDLEYAFQKADDINTHRIQDYLAFLHKQAPTACYGSREKVEKWLAGREDEE